MRDLGKWQLVRLVDIFFLGPFMMTLAREISDHIDEWKYKTLFFFGASTILVNAYFFLKVGGWLT